MNDFLIANDHLTRLKGIVNDPNTYDTVIRLDCRTLDAIRWAIEELGYRQATSRPRGDGGDVELRKDIQDLSYGVGCLRSYIDRLTDRIEKAELQIDGLIAKLDRVTKALGETP
jgi:hypothetical protein